MTPETAATRHDLTRDEAWDLLTEDYARTNMARSWKVEREYNFADPAVEGADIIQNSMLQVLSSTDGTPGKGYRYGRPSTIMYSVISNQAINQYRKGKHNMSKATDTDTLVWEDHALGHNTTPTVEEAAFEEENELVTFLNDQSMNQDQVNVLKLCAEGYSYKEIADELVIPLGTVMSRLCRARRNAQSIIASAVGTADKDTLPFARFDEAAALLTQLKQQAE